MSANIIAYDFHAQRASEREAAENRLARAVNVLHKSQGVKMTPANYNMLQQAVDDAQGALNAIGADAGYLRAGE